MPMFSFVSRSFSVRCVLKNSNMTALLDLEQENMFFCIRWLLGSPREGARERERESFYGLAVDIRRR